MEIFGKVIEIIPTVSGENERGEWSRAGFVVETYGEYTIQLALELHNDSIQRLMPPLNAIVKAQFSVSSRKVVDKWFTSTRCYKVEVQ